MVFVACIRSRFGICRVTPRIPRIVLSDISDNTGILSENSRILLSDAAAVLSDIRSEYWNPVRSYNARNIVGIPTLQSPNVGFPTRDNLSDARQKSRARSRSVYTTVT